MARKTEKAKDGLQVKENKYMDFDAKTDEVQLSRGHDENRLWLSINGREYGIGRVASAFPLSAALERIVFFNSRGEEIGCLKGARHLDQNSLKLLLEELDRAYFMPSIESVDDITDHLGLELWRVHTNRGARTFEVRQPEKNVRIISPRRMIVKDVDGNRYEIKNWHMLDKKSLALLMRYL